MRKNLILVAVATVLSAALFVVIFEVAGSLHYDSWKSAYQQEGDWYQGLTVPSDNETLMWEYQPHKVAEKWGVDIRTNASGFRDREHDVQKPDGVRRIAFVGDSITVGLGVEQESIFVRRFEAVARQAEGNTSLEALGFAVDGYNAIQVLELAKSESLRFLPDEIIYVMCMNDFDLEDASARKILYFRKPKSFLLRTINRLHRRFVEYHDYYFHKYKSVIYQEILQTAALLREKEIDFRIALIPAFPKGTFENYPLAQIHEELKAWLSENNVPVLDFLDTFVAQGRAPRTFARDIYHLNEEGHQIVASGLAKSLLPSQNGEMVKTDTP